MTFQYLFCFLRQQKYEDGNGVECSVLRQVLYIDIGITRSIIRLGLFGQRTLAWISYSIYKLQPLRHQFRVFIHDRLNMSNVLRPFESEQSNQEYLPRLESSCGHHVVSNRHFILIVSDIGNEL